MHERRKRFERLYGILEEEYPDTSSFISFAEPFQLLVGVILSAQSTDRQVNLILPELFARFPTPGDLAEAPVEEIEALVRSVGFFRMKARNIKETARLVHERWGGRVPERMEDLLLLPGVGRKSANVIRGTIYGRPAIIVDTHFGRVVRRLGLTEEHSPERIERDLASWIPPEKQYPFSMRVNRHGRAVCTARRPACASCRLAPFCPRCGVALKGEEGRGGEGDGPTTAARSGGSPRAR
ncbi:endonuclease III domain-containing protein [Spirochaeta thermophila]|uniref:Endonuclease III n=1 Tax=Winmispira thermophila (strain ATCC 49972 / DSM 6192 / RI 19.B1) TaxID=665571 RepID=E0RQT9_WINT6|nr:endonuclease III [Spirochaeta thermophila]ADN02995.1 endonuclease III [Spirochaeta thermophila DSM 6192]